MKKYRHQKRNLLFAIDVHSVISPHFDKKILVRLNLYVQNPRPIIILISCRTHRTTIIPPVRHLPYFKFAQLRTLWISPWIALLPLTSTM